RLAAEQQAPAVRRERRAVLTVHPPWRDPLSITRRADRLHEDGGVLLRAVAHAQEGERPAVGRERRIGGVELCWLSRVAAGSAGHLASITPVHPHDEDRRAELPTPRILHVG